MATMKDSAIKTLIAFAARKAPEADVAEQIQLYQALCVTLPSATGRRNAGEICKALSRAAALQMDFHTELFK